MAKWRGHVLLHDLARARSVERWVHHDLAMARKVPTTFGKGRAVVRRLDEGCRAHLAKVGAAAQDFDDLRGLRNALKNRLTVFGAVAYTPVSAPSSFLYSSRHAAISSGSL